MARDPILERAFSQRLAVKRVAEQAHITTAAVSQWQRVPKRHVHIVAAVTGIPAHELRPDIYPIPVRGDVATDVPDAEAA